LRIVKEKHHNHESNEEHNKQLRFNNTIKQKAKTSSSSSVKILNECINSYTASTIPVIFNKKSIYKSINNTKTKEKFVDHYFDKSEIPKFLQSTLKNEKFLQ
jgi:hypothetical protein